MSTLDHITDPNQRRQVARNLQIHAWYMKVVNDLEAYDLNDFALTVVSGLYRHEGSSNPPEEGSINFLAQSGRAITYRVVNRRSFNLAPEMTFDVALFIKNFLPFERLILDYDTYDPSGQMASNITIVTPEIPADYVSATFSNEVETRFNGELFSAGELAELGGPPGAYIQEVHYSERYNIDQTRNPAHIGYDGTNGRIDPATLVQVQDRSSLGYGIGPILLQPDAARRFIEMRNHARSEGVNIVLSAGYRSYYYQYLISIDPNEPVFAQPGRSNHGMGTAIDVSEGVDWITRLSSDGVNTNGALYGFINRLPNDPVHFSQSGR